MCLLIFFKVFIVGAFAQASNDTLPDLTVPLADTAPIEDSISVPVDDLPLTPEEETSSFTLKQFQPNGGGPSSYDPKTLSKEQLNSFRGDEDFWYANATPEKKQKAIPEKPSIISTSAFQNILWIVIIVVFVGALFFYLAGSNIGLFKRSKKITELEESDLDDSDIFAINYPKEIAKAEKDNNFRLAVRLNFLLLLSRLSEKKFIQYEHDRTNREYLQQVDQSTWYRDFFRVTRNYEYSWYGLFDVNASQYALLKNDFETLSNKIGS